MEDLRETLFFKYEKEGWSGDAGAVGFEDAKLMLDEYFEKKVKEELLPWMVEKGVESYKGANGLPFFYYDKEPHTIDEIFQDFL